MRYKVVTTEGWPITGGSGRGADKPGLTASVLDTEVIHREVARFRSEDLLSVLPKRTRGHDGAISAAQEYADALNAGCAAAQVPPRARVTVLRRKHFDEDAQVDVLSVWGYRAVCPDCWQGERRFTISTARRDLRAHLDYWHKRH